MRRTNTFVLEPTGEQNEMLEFIGEHSAALWNKINYNRRQCLFNDYPIDWETNFHSDFTGVVGCAVTQQVFRKNNQSWKSYFALLKKKAKHKLPEDQEAKPPGYWKDRDTGKRKLMIIERNDSYSLKGQFLYVPISKKLRKQHGIRNRIKIRIKGQLKWKGKQGQLEIIYDSLKGKWYAHQSVEVKKKPLHQSRKKAYVDLGVKNLIAVMTTNSARIYSGRPVLAEWWYWTNRIAMHQSELKTVNKKQASKELRRLYCVRKRRFRHSIDAMIRSFMEFCEREDIGKIVVGDVRHIREDCRKGMKARKTRAMVNNFWSFGFVIQRLQNKAEEYGRSVVFMDESYTSRTCPKCGHRVKSNRKHRGLFVCKKCGYTQNADLVGTLNLMKNDNCDISNNRLMAKPSLLRWNYAIWE